MYGVLVDVSGSMRSAYAVDKSRITTVSRSHAIFMSILNIVKKESNHEDEIFVGAFGLNMPSVTTCDLLGLLNKATKVPKEMQGVKPGVEAIVQLAEKEGYGAIVDWIRRELSEEMAKDLFELICIKPSIKDELLEKLPSNRIAKAAKATYDTKKYAAATIACVYNYLSNSNVDVLSYYEEIEQNKVRNSAAFHCAQDLVSRKSEIIEKVVSEIQTPKPLHAQSAVELFQELKLAEDDSSSGFSGSVRKNIDETLKCIKPYIYGYTPMVKAMRDALSIFRKFKKDNPTKQMTLLILTDGKSTDGNPKVLADQIKELDVTIVTCFLTNKHLDYPYKCYDDSEISSPLSPVLLEMSSIKHNNDSPMYYLADAGWKLPLSGESRLYIEANTLEVVNEVCEKVISELNNPFRDGITDILNVVGVQDLIGESLENSVPEDQEETRTCYAHAIAAVMCFAMHRIVDREGGHPEFRTIREELIQEFGHRHANVYRILSNVCRRYDLTYKEVNEMEAKIVLNYRRPLVATFNYSKKQSLEFKEFYEYNPCGILHKENLEGELNNFALQLYETCFLLQLMIHLMSLVMR